MARWRWCELLLDHGADPTLMNRFGRTALDFAIEYGYRDSTAILGKAIAKRVGLSR